MAMTMTTVSCTASCGRRAFAGEQRERVYNTAASDVGEPLLRLPTT
jgi:hypothetical protein